MKSDTYLKFSILVILILLNIQFINGTGLTDDNSTAIQFLALNHEFIIYRRKLMWSEALDFCTKCVGEIATFATPAEAIKVSELIYYQSSYPYGFDHGLVRAEWGLTRRYWFGLSDEQSEGNWMWIKATDDTGTLVTDIKKYRWYPGQPDHVNKNSEHCGAFWNPEYQLDRQKIKKKIKGRREIHYFNDEPCEHQLYFICKIGELLPTDPTDPVCNAMGNVTVASAGNGTETPTPASDPAHELGPPFTVEEFMQSRGIAIKWHDIFRLWHNVPIIAIDTELNVEAQKAAEQLITLDKHGAAAGENLYLIIQSLGKPRFNPALMVEMAIKDWFFEFCDTEYWPRGEMNHYTQLIWKHSMKLGIGIATNKLNTKLHIVARYDPPGNYRDEYKLDVSELRCNVNAICDGMLPKNVTRIEDCPDASTPESKAEKEKNKHLTEPVKPKERPPRVLEKRHLPSGFKFWDI